VRSLRSAFGLERLTPQGYLLAGLFLVASLALVAVPMVPELFDHGKGKDYPLWFTVGQRMLHGAPVYVAGQNGAFDFLYTPFAALLLAIPSYFGKATMVTLLACTTLASWWMAIWLSIRLAGSEQEVSPWNVAWPIVVTLPFVYDQFLNGQPNLLLLTLMLAGFFLLRARRTWLAGLPFAVAAAIKIFPVLVLPYLLWRRQWRTSAGMATFMILFLLVVPATVRGWDRNLGELDQWVHGMLLSGNDEQFSQRPENFGWKNQSLYALEHRLLRPIDAEYSSDEATPSIQINLLNLDKRTADEVFLATAILIGLCFIALLPTNGRRTSRSDAAEWAILLLLMVIASPVNRSYYFVWMLFPYTVLARWLASEPNRNAAVRIAIATGFSLLLLVAGINVIQPRYPQAAGNFFWAAMVVILILAVRLRRAALPVPSGQSQTTVMAQRQIRPAQ
jgi:hypothetical protein